MGRTVALLRTSEGIEEPIRIGFNDRKLSDCDRLKMVFGHRLARALWLSFGRGQRVFDLESWCLRLAVEIEKLGYFPEASELYQMVKMRAETLPGQIVLDSFAESNVFFSRLAEALRDPLAPITYIEA
jgi:hypothetical protein